MILRKQGYYTMYYELKPNRFKTIKRSWEQLWIYMSHNMMLAKIKFRTQVKFRRQLKN